MAKELTLKIEYGTTAAEFNLENSQLFSLKRNGVDVMWPGGAPKADRPKEGWQNSWIKMFPVVGLPLEGRLLIDGTYYPMAQHGIARDLPFKAVQSDPKSVTFEQVYEGGQKVLSSKGTVSLFPRSYRLTQTYTVGWGVLGFASTLENTSEKDLPYATGEHPAFIALEHSTIEILRREKTIREVSLENVREADGNVLEFPDNATVIYRTPAFQLMLNHQFGNTQIWHKEKCVAIEPITNFSLSRHPNSQENYKLLRRGEKITHSGIIDIRTV